MTAVVLLVIAFVPMLFEAQRSNANERALRAAGAVEPPDDIYPVMRLAYPGCFLAMVVESWLRASQLSLGGAALFALAKALKYWAIATLGPRWTFRVLVPKDSEVVRHGPYRWLRHPNYIGVMGELVGFAWLAAAPLTGALAALAFGVILMIRIRVEERALGLRSQAPRAQSR
jgi:methyltransferase